MFSAPEIRAIHPPFLFDLDAMASGLVSKPLYLPLYFLEEAQRDGITPTILTL